MKPKVVDTLLATAKVADARGVTTVNRKTIAEVVGIDVRTVTEHWKLARTAGLMSSRRRFNRSSVHVLLPSDGDTPHLADRALSLTPHVWTVPELEWWSHLTEESANAAPWGEGTCPF